MSRRLYGDCHDEDDAENADARRDAACPAQTRGSQLLLRTAVANARSLFGRGNPMTLVTSRELADSSKTSAGSRRRWRYGEPNWPTLSKEFGEFDVYVAISLAGLGEHCLRARQVSAAERYFRRALDVRQHVHPAGHWRIDAARVMVAATLVEAGRFWRAAEIGPGSAPPSVPATPMYQGSGRR